MNPAFAAKPFTVDGANRVVTYETTETLGVKDFDRSFAGLPGDTWGDTVSKFVVNASNVRALGGWTLPRLNLPLLFLKLI